MKKLIYTLVCMLAVSAFSVPSWAGPDYNWFALQHELRQQQRQYQRWEAVKHSTGAARQEALQNYLYNRPGLWDETAHIP